VSKVVKVISFRETVLFKRGVVLSVLALIVCTATPAFAGAGPALIPSLAATGAMAAVCAYFVYRTRMLALVDEVMDCEDHLKVRRGRREVTIPMSGIRGAEISSAAGIHRITLRLRAAGELGGTLDFLPQASLWSNRPVLNAMAGELTARARQADPGGLPD
jgi:hypothetical protein